MLMLTELLVFTIHHMHVCTTDEVLKKHATSILIVEVRTTSRPKAELISTVGHRESRKSVILNESKAISVRWYDAVEAHRVMNYRGSYIF
jgi:hypothetical protein